MGAVEQVDGAAVMRRISWRILPLLGLAYLVAFMDRSNISFAAKTMNADLGFSATIYGIGGGVFFLSYSLFEIPSNLILQRVGARWWIARIMITWGIIAAAMMFVRVPWQFYTLRFLLGLAEAGFFPGVIFYLSLWFPREARGRAISRFYISGPLTRVVMGVASVWLLALNGWGGLKGWQWLFVGEGLPAVAVGILVYRLLPDRPETADWLSAAEKRWLTGRLAGDASVGDAHRSPLAALRMPAVLLLGMAGLLTTCAYYSFTLSEPMILAAATGWSTVAVGYLVSAGGLMGAAGMLFTGWLSDKVGTRAPFMVGSTVLVMLGYGLFAVHGGPVLGLIAYALYGACWGSVTLSIWMLCSDLVRPRDMAVATAMVNTMSQIGAFFGPIAWGVARDATGGFGAGFVGLVLVQGLAVVFALVIVRQPKKGVAVAVAG
jgi:ACS family tartrate transporter-like MFS transporter